MRMIVCFLTAASLLSGAALASDWPKLSSPAQPVAKAEQDAAVVVAIEKYAFVSSIPGAVDNADAWYDYLTKTLGVPFERVTLLKNEDATREDIVASLKKAADQTGKDGTLWFIFIGHGTPSPDGKGGVLVGVDAQQKASSLQARGLGEPEARRILAQSQAGRIRVILDSCFSGRDSSGGTLAPGLQPLVVLSPAQSADPRLAVLTAARGDQFAGPLPGASRPAFSYLTLGALRGWTGAKAVTAGDVLDYANKVLSAMVRGRQQVATLSGNPQAPMAPSAGEAGPDLASLQKTASNAAPMFKAAEPAPVDALKAPSALGATAGMDWKTLDVDALEAYNRIVSFDKSDSSAAEKAARWTEFALKYPGRKDAAEERARAWRQYALTARRAIAAAVARHKSLEKDWDKLARLHKMEVIGQKDKESWSLQFLDAYQWRVEARLPSLSVLFPEGSLDSNLEERRESCGTGRQLDCLAAAIMIEEGFGVKKDQPGAQDMYASLCDAGFARGCHNLGRMKARALGVPKDSPAALEAYDKACEAGYPTSCNNIGIMHYNGEGIPKDYAKAAEYYRRACDMGDSYGCTDLGVLYGKGEGVPKNEPRGGELYRQACDMGDGLGCTNLGVQFNNGEGVAKDLERARSFYQMACDRDDPSGCNNLGILYENGGPMPKDLERAKTHYRMACDRELQIACDNLRRLGQ